MTIPFTGLGRQYRQHRDELLTATDRVYATGQVLDGEFTHDFERAMATRCHRAYAIAVNSCTQGLIFAMHSTTSSRVLIPAVSFAATVNSVLQAGHEPVFCDVDGHALMDLESLEDNLAGTGISTVMYANLFGNVVDWDRFRVQTEFFSDQMFIIEDAAQSFGAWYQDVPSGKLGDVSVLSFDPTKNLPNYGSGGMILTDNFDLACVFLDLRNNGKTGNHLWSGTNSKMSEADCAQMLVKLQYFDAWQQRRADIAAYYESEISDHVQVLKPNAGVTHAWHKFVIRTNHRDALALSLTDAGIETKIHYATTLTELPVVYPHGQTLSHIREAYGFTSECLSLPMYPELSDSEVEAVAQCVRNYFEL
jgi:dTDP-4-amino-4,6-dideoxygalactose transaminase